MESEKLLSEFCPAELGALGIAYPQREIVLGEVFFLFEFNICTDSFVQIIDAKRKHWSEFYPPELDALSI